MPWLDAGNVDKFRDHAERNVAALLSKIEPEYSEEARRARFQGIVVLDTIVREDGSVQVLRVAQSLGFGLDQRAADAVRQWKFNPARRYGTPVDVIVEVAVEFKLR